MVLPSADAANAPELELTDEQVMSIIVALNPDDEHLALTFAWLHGPEEGRAAALARSQAMALAATLERNRLHAESLGWVIPLPR